MESGKPAKENYAYSKHGSCCVLAAIEPKTGKRLAHVKKQRTKKEFALFMFALAKCYPEAVKIKVVLDNLNTCLLYTSPSPRDATLSRMPSSA